MSDPAEAAPVAIPRRIFVRVYRNAILGSVFICMGMPTPIR